MSERLAVLHVLCCWFLCVVLCLMVNKGCSCCVKGRQAERRDRVCERAGVVSGRLECPSFCRVLAGKVVDMLLFMPS